MTFTGAARRFLKRMRVARLATTDLTGQPHVVPIVFAIDDRRLYTPIDRKPKRVEPTALKRVRNLLANPRIAIVVDEYDDDWSRLAWVLVKGRAEIVDRGEAHVVGVQLLHEKYAQYRTMPLDDRPLIVVTPDSVGSWGLREG